jgi:aminoglycoside phosphotransferase (APT) family kinase protein
MNPEPTMDLEACLPAALRGPTTTITRIAAGLSGAGVYRVEAAGQPFVLKIAADEPRWRGVLHVQRLAADAGLAPAIVHVDEARRAVLSAFVADRSFPMRYGDPRTRDAAIALLGRTLRRVHDLPRSPDIETRDSGALLASFAANLADFALPAFVTDAIARARAEAPPPCDRPAVLSHNDVNPTNLVLDGERLVLVDWDTAGLNDPYYDLATISVFLRMDDATCRALLAAHDGDAAPPAALPARFVYDRRHVAVLCGAAFLHLAHKAGHPGATHAEPLSLADMYQRLRAGALDVGAPDGQWQFGLALVNEGAAI